MRRGFLILAAVALLAIPLPARATSYAVQIDDDFFDRASRIIRVGDRVTWMHSGEREHTVTSFPDSPKQFSSSDSNNCVPAPILNDPDDCLDPGATYGPITFDRPGVIEYYCKVHGTTARRPDPARSNSAQPCGMCGRIDVRAASTKAPGAGQTGQPSREASASPSRSPSRSASPSPDAGTASASPSPSPVGSGGGAAGRGSIALIGIMVLSGAGYLTWRRYIVPR